MPADHRLTTRSTVRPQDLGAERLIGVPAAKSPVLRSVTDAYAKRVGVNLEPDYEVDNISMTISLVVSTGGIALMPLYARNLLPPTVVSRPLDGEPPVIDIALGYRRDSPLPQLAAISSRIKRRDGAAPSPESLGGFDQIRGAGSTGAIQAIGKSGDPFMSR
jgi:LysR family transcriptional regulator, hca operon transcriptional activator